MKKFFVIGNKVSNSLSPTIFNYWFKKYNVDAEYSLIDIPENDLPIIVKDIRNKNFFIKVS